MSKTVQIKSSSGDKYQLSIDGGDITILQLKNDLEKQCNIPAAEQRLIYKGMMYRYVYMYISTLKLLTVYCDCVIVRLCIT